MRLAGSVEIDRVRARVQAANARFSEAMTLGNRTTAALDILLSSKNLSHVLKACFHLGMWPPPPPPSKDALRVV